MNREIQMDRRIYIRTDRQINNQINRKIRYKATLMDVLNINRSKKMER